MSTAIAKNFQVGSDSTATNNFTIRQPATPDGTVRIANGNSGTTTDLVTVTSAGNVGVGTTSPLTKLHLSDAGSVFVQMTDQGDGASRIGQNGTALTFGVDTSNGATERMRIDSSGNLGLGVTPSAWSLGKAIEVGTVGNSIWGVGSSNMVVGSNIYYASSSYKYANTAAASAYQQAGGVHYWYTAPSGTAGNIISFTQAMTLDSSGRLLVGTTTAADSNAMLNVYNPNATSAQIVLQNTTTGVGSNGSRLLATGNDLYITNKENGFMAFETNDTERARITSGGDLLVNRTSTLGTAKFVVEADTTTANPMTVSNSRSTAATDYSILFYRNASLVGSVQTSLTATSYVTSSDYRLKENIQPMTGALAKVAALKPVTYKWKATGGEADGFIAHELAEVCPQAVTGEKDAVDADGNPKYQGIDTSFLVATLTAALQELKAELDSVKTELALLKGTA